MKSSISSKDIAHSGRRAGTKARRISALAAAIFCLTACNDSNEGPRLSENELDLQLKSHTWTYVSLERGVVVAEVAFADTLTQEELRQRTDWDIALAPDGLLRTNSGLSGTGQAAVCATSEDYSSAEVEASGTALGTDSDLKEVW